VRLLSDIAAFISSLADYWGWLLGSVAFTAYSIYERRRGEEMAWRRFRWVVLGCVLIAIFLSWEAQYRRAEELDADRAIRDKREADLLTRPQLNLFIEAIGFGRNNDPVAGPVTVLVAMLVVTNGGADSVAKQWAAYVHKPGQERIALTASFQSAPIEFPGVSLVPENNIVTKTSGAPIARGAAVHGHLLAKTKLSKDELLSSDWILTITCEDVRGTEAQAETPIRGNSAGGVVHQGL
jgi:hypothetical protein